MPKSITSIDDAGFNEPAKPRSDSGDTKSPVGNTEPKGTTEKFGGFDSISPIDFIDGGTDAPNSQPRRRGRPPGTRNKPTEKTAQNLVTDIESLLVSLHFMAAKFLRTDELELDPIEAKKMSDSIKKVAAFYPIGMDPKKVAWAEFWMNVGAIYIPRGIAIYKKKPSKEPSTIAAGPIPVTTKVAPNGAPGVPAKEGRKVQSPSEMWDQSPIEDGTW